MFALVADIESYPGFLPWCKAAVVRPAAPALTIASLQVAKGPFSQWLTTRNRHVESAAIEIALVDGPFRHLEGEWRFEPESRGGARVSFSVEFEFASRMVGRLLSPAFREITRSLLAAFRARADELHGGG
jgi:ribosome-associated toxin RatA of RatAB toxin-antitoxin module